MKRRHESVPTNHWFKYHEARNLMKRGDYSEANTILDIYPIKSQQWTRNKLHCLLNLGKYQEAIHFCENQFVNDWALRDLARCHAGLREYDKAIHYLQSIQSKDKKLMNLVQFDLIAFLKLKKRSEQEIVRATPIQNALRVSSAEETSSNAAIKAMLKSARAYTEIDNFTEAGKLHDSIMQSLPNDKYGTRLHLKVLLGFMYYLYQKKEFILADAQYEEIFRIWGQDHQSLIDIARWFVKHHNPVAGINTIIYMINNQLADRNDLLWVLGKFYRLSTQPEKALDIFLSIDNWKEDKDVVYDMMLCYQAMGLYQEAVDIYDQYFKWTEEVMAATCLALCQQKLNRFLQAEKIFQHLLESNPDNVQIHALFETCRHEHDAFRNQELESQDMVVEESSFVEPEQPGVETSSPEMSKYTPVLTQLTTSPNGHYSNGSAPLFFRNNDDSTAAASQPHNRFSYA